MTDRTIQGRGRAHNRAIRWEDKAVSKEPSERQKFLEWENEYLRRKIKEFKRSELFYRSVIPVALVVWFVAKWWMS